MLNALKFSISTAVLFVAMALFAVIALFAAPKQADAAITPLSQIQPGDLIRAQTLTAVYYYGNDNLRYVFPNDRTYFTWYSNFDTVKWITDADMFKVQIGGNVTYKPGVKMVKVNSDPKTYALAHNGTLRWVKTEQVAVTLYGSTWNKQIDDIPDGFFSNYKIGAEIEDATTYNKASELSAASSINIDKELVTPKDVTISNSAYSPTSVTIKAGQTVRFLNSDSTTHTITADNLTWGSGSITTGNQWIKKYTTAGTYTYHCSIHPEMTGTVIVEENL
ncbi:MAG: Copper-binding protein, plastocyanin/azurin family [uncultured bacterium]|nr:MAG: Copper-binding protein, plastocyanin/azurin family [uncultured bacterium]HBD05121.1 hypothetical protein [Candidatus Uhrbacteria bacterium]